MQIFKKCNSNCVKMLCILRIHSKKSFFFLNCNSGLAGALRGKVEIVSTVEENCPIDNIEEEETEREAGAGNPIDGNSSGPSQLREIERAHRAIGALKLMAVNVRLVLCPTSWRCWRAGRPRMITTVVRRFSSGMEGRNERQPTVLRCHWMSNCVAFFTLDSGGDGRCLWRNWTILRRRQNGVQLLTQLEARLLHLLTASMPRRNCSRNDCLLFSSLFSVRRRSAS